jgi:hypothetical protein
VGGKEREATAKYAPSPLARHDKALKTAAALILLEVAPATINFELCRQFGYAEGDAAAVIHEAFRLVPRPRQQRNPRVRTR